MLLAFACQKLFAHLLCVLEKTSHRQQLSHFLQPLDVRGMSSLTDGRDHKRCSNVESVFALLFFSCQHLNLHIWGASRVNIALLWSWFTKCVPWRLTPNLNCQLGTARDWWWGIMIVYMLHLHPIFWCVLVMMLTVVWRSVPEIKAAQQHFWARWLDLIRSEWVLLLPQSQQRFTVYWLM